MMRGIVANQTSKKVLNGAQASGHIRVYPKGPLQLHGPMLKLQTYVFVSSTPLRNGLHRCGTFLAKHCEQGSFLSHFCFLR